MVDEVVLETPNEEKKKEVVEKPTGYYLANVPTNFAQVIAFGDKEVLADELLVKVANAVKKAGLLKD